MSNERERLAREWAKYAKKLEVSSPEEQAAAEHIMATTKEPTMADTGWDRDKHHLAGATLLTGSDRTDVVMLAENGNGIYFATSDWGLGWEPHYYLAPNGKRYKLVEVTGDEHPETLTTLGDYANAPEGTVVEGEGKLPWTRLEYVWKETAGDVQNDVGMAGTERRVLRRGWGE